MPEPPLSEQQRAEAALKRGIAEVKTRADAADTLDALERKAGALTEPEVAAAHPQNSSESAARALEKAATASSGSDSPAAEVIGEAAAQVASASRKEKEPLDAAIGKTTGSEAQSEPAAPDVKQGRRLLRQELIRRLRPLKAIDAIVFIEVNHLPHPPALDKAVSGFSWIMTAGTGWLFILLTGILRDRRSGWRAAAGVAPALWLATTTVEQPLKRFFRRRRPFISMIRAIVVGRKPGSYSFPSGHSAAAFAGAVLLARHYPAGRRAFYGIATLVAFSRVYLGAHYPGDVITGSLAGAALGPFWARVLRFGWKFFTRR